MRIGIAVVCLAALALTGCATILDGSHQQVQVTSNPPGAQVRLDGAEVGSTPCRIAVDRGVDHTVSVAHSSGQQRTAQLRHSVQAGWVILDILCGLIPLIIDAATGAWHGISPDPLHIEFGPERVSYYGPDEWDVAMGPEEEHEAIRIPAPE